MSSFISESLSIIEIKNISAPNAIQDSLSFESVPQFGMKVGDMIGGTLCIKVESPSRDRKSPPGPRWNPPHQAEFPQIFVKTKVSQMDFLQNS